MNAYQITLVITAVFLGVGIYAYAKRGEIKERLVLWALTRQKTMLKQSKHLSNTALSKKLQRELRIKRTLGKGKQAW